MDFLTTAAAVCGKLSDVSDEQQPLVRVAMQLAVQPWLRGGHTDRDLLHWGEFAIEIQDVEVSWWTDPPQHLLAVDTQTIGGNEAAAAAALADSIADVFDRAADCSSGTLAWQRAASAAALRDAAAGLRDGLVSAG